MNQTIDSVLGAVTMAVAIFYFDSKSSNQIIISTLLFGGGLSILLLNANMPALKTTARILRLALIIVGAGFLLKLLLD